MYGHASAIKVRLRRIGSSPTPSLGYGGEYSVHDKRDIHSSKAQLDAGYTEHEVRRVLNSPVVEVLCVALAEL